MKTLILVFSTGLVHASGGQAYVSSSSLTSEFPRGFRITAQAIGENEIISIAVRLKMGQRTPSTYNYLDIQPGRVVEGELFWSTKTASRYVPPGTVITYRFEIEDVTGALIETEPKQFIYRDSRFQWTEITDGQVTVSYHGSTRSRADTVLSTALETIHRMSPVLGSDTGEPIAVTIYNNWREMQVALPPSSRVARRQLITAGQATAEFGTILVLGAARGVTSHEVTHILVHRAGNSSFQRVPLWLNEGLAEYASLDRSLQHERALEVAISTKRLLPSFLRAYPGSSEDIILFYAQSRSIVRFMVDTFGAGEMKRLLDSLRSGSNIANAIQDVYGMTMQEMDNLWRQNVGARQRGTGVNSTPSLPTSIPVRAILPYSLTPQPGVQFVGNLTSDRTNVDGQLQEQESQEPASGGSSCTAVSNNGHMPVDMAMGGLLIGLSGLVLRRRIMSSRGSDE